MIAAITLTQTAGESSVESESPHFRAVFTPNRSLGGLGFFLVMARIYSVSFAIGIAFWLKGAWPVMGLFGLDVILNLRHLPAHLSQRTAYRDRRADRASPNRVPSRAGQEVAGLGVRALLAPGPDQGAGPARQPADAVQPRPAARFRAMTLKSGYRRR